MYTLNGYRVLNSLEELCITGVATGNSFVRVLKLRGGEDFKKIFRESYCESKEIIF